MLLLQVDVAGSATIYRVEKEVDAGCLAANIQNASGIRDRFFLIDGEKIKSFLRYEEDPGDFGWEDVREGNPEEEDENATAALLGRIVGTAKPIDE